MTQVCRTQHPWLDQEQRLWVIVARASVALALCVTRYLQSDATRTTLVMKVQHDATAELSSTGDRDSLSLDIFHEAPPSSRLVY